MNNIPKSQFKRIKRNCTRDEDFATQSQIIKNRFLERGYKPSLIENSYKKICDGTQTKNTSKSVEENTVVAPFITNYHKGAEKLKRIINKNWFILKNDSVIGNRLPEKPKIVFRKAPNLRDIITHSYIKEDNAKRSCLSGFFNCAKCKACTEAGMTNRKKNIQSIEHNGVSYNIQDFSTCDSINVIYVLICPCNLWYIGRTSRKLKTRVREHCRNIRLGLETHSVPAHYKIHHNRDPAGLRFFALEVIKSWWRGDNLDQKLNQREAYWIYHLKTLTPAGLNIDFELKCFLQE